MKDTFFPIRQRWMLVDDDDSAREAIAGVLAIIAKVEVVTFPSGAAALKAFTAAPDLFEFVVTDLDMPAMSGIEFCRHVKASRPDCKILLATGSGIITHAEALDFGFCGLLRKPFSVHELRQTLMHVRGLEDAAPRATEARLQTA